MIKTFLKQNGITLIEFANDLNISRPTLDIYIKNYDSGCELSNPLFQKIFGFLFDDQTADNNDFNSKYEYVKSYYGKKDADLHSLAAKSINSSEYCSEDEYITICDNLIELLETSKNKTRFSLEKIKTIKKLLFEEMPEFDVLWQGQKHAVIKLKNLNIYYLCLIMSMDDVEAFRPEDVFLYEKFKFCKLKEDQSCEYLITLGKNLEY